MPAVRQSSPLPKPAHTHTVSACVGQLFSTRLVAIFTRQMNARWVSSVNQSSENLPTYSGSRTHFRIVAIVIHLAPTLNIQAAVTGEIQETKHLVEIAILWNFHKKYIYTLEQYLAGTKFKILF